MNQDVLWFDQHRRRDFHIRQPFPGEFQQAWLMLGDHDRGRRRVLIWRVPKNNPGRRLLPEGLMRIPFLAFADETIEDDDRVLKRIMDGLMKEASETADDDGFIRTGSEVMLAAPQEKTGS